MKSNVLLAIVGVAVVPTATLMGAPSAGREGTINKADAKSYLTIKSKLEPDQGNLFRKLIQMFGLKDTYTTAEVRAVSDPDSAYAGGEEALVVDQKGPPPQDTFTYDEVKRSFEAQALLDPSNKGLLERLVMRYKKQDWYTATQIRDVGARPVIKSPTPEEQRRADATLEALQRGEAKEWQSRQGFRFPRIRQDWRDVLYEEDPSQADNERKTLGDLVGAQFSYTRDGRVDSDTWAAHGAVIFPYTRDFKPRPEFGLTRFSLAPSVTVDRVTTNGDPSVETNTVLYRLGVYMDFLGLTRKGTAETTGDPTQDALNRAKSFGIPYGLQVRAAGVYVSDMDNRGSLSGFEADFEPRILTKGMSLGYRKILIGKNPLKPDGSDISIAECQLRAWLHMEGGNVQDAGPAWTVSPESFFRLGPTVEFKFQLPSLPGGRALSLTALYSYLASVSGPNDHPWYFRSTLAYDLFRDVEYNHKVALTADYQRGGLNFTKEEVDTFTIGLGVLF